MHIEMRRQLVADRIEELRADAQRSRHQRVRRSQRAAEAGQAFARRQWRGMIHALVTR